MIKFQTITKISLLVWSFSVVGCSFIPADKTWVKPPELTSNKALGVLNRQLSRPYSIYKHRRRFRTDSKRQQLIKARYIKKLNIDRANGFIDYTQTQEGGFDYVKVNASGFMPSVPVYALNQFGFAFADGERVIDSITSIDGDVVNFQLRLIPGPILVSRGFTDSSRVYNGRAKLEYNHDKQRYDVIVFEQFSEIRQQWRKLGFEIENSGQKTVFFIDPGTELLFEFLAKHDAQSKSFKAMQPYQKYISPIKTR